MNDLHVVIEQPIWPAIVGLAAALLTLVLRQMRPAVAASRRRSSPGVLILAAVCLAGCLFPRPGLFGWAVFVAAALALISVTRTIGRAAPAVAPRAAAALRVLAWMLLLAIVAEPAWTWRETEYRRPILAVLLDRSQSMSIRDGGADAPTRADRVNAALADALPRIARLADLYDVRLLAVGGATHELNQWSAAPEYPKTALAAALRTAGALRSEDGTPPAAILLISDGAETEDEPTGVYAAASELARRDTQLLAVGVGPALGRVPQVRIAPLDVPAQVSTRDRIELVARARILAAPEADVALEVLWGESVAHKRLVRPDSDDYASTERFELHPPGAGLHRLTVRYALDKAHGGDTYMRSTLIDVRDDAIRVLFVDRRARSEFAFAARALRGDARFDVRMWIPSRSQDAGAPEWGDYHVVVLGGVDASQLGAGDLPRLAESVAEDGIGLLLAGGEEFFNNEGAARAAFADVSPVEFTRRRNPQRFRPRFMPTVDGLRHPVLRGLAEADDENRSLPARIWSDLPELSRTARLGKPKPLATVLASNQAGEPLLVVQDVGAGRCAAAAWEATWPWALSSDDGLALHRRFWRQLVAWLANRRPRAWILADKPAYERGAIARDSETIRIRAGISGLDDSEPSDWRPIARLKYLGRARPATATTATAPTGPATGARAVWMLNFQRADNEWTAQLPAALPALDWLSAGRFELAVEFHRVRSDAGRDAREDEPLRAASGFTISDVPRELTPPTSNLPLLREAVERGAALGGFYGPLESLPAALDSLLATDPRRAVLVERRFAPTASTPGLLLAALLVLLTIEWMIRKRAGLT